MDGMSSDWIKTGPAAALLGYSPEHFRNKFDGLIPCKRYRSTTGAPGCRMWYRPAILQLLSEADPAPKAG